MQWFKKIVIVVVLLWMSGLGHPQTEGNTDWATLIDATWGVGLPTHQKLEIFDRIWKEIDEEYGAFMNLQINMDSLRNIYRPEIEQGVSKGRFVAIMNHLSMALKDGHTFITNWSIYRGNAEHPAQPGTPIFVLSTAKQNDHFGACLTPMPDSTLLVYRALPNHTLGLVPGDIVLGYNGILWKDLYKELLDAQLPIDLLYVFGSTNESMTHYLLQSAGLNWHLFDTIQIVKYATGDTLSLSTSLLLNQRGHIWGNEQLDVPGVHQPDFWNEDYITYGIVEGTSIGYIYVAAWYPEDRYRISEQFYEAVFELMQNHSTSGLIIDMRCNYGGSMLEADEGYSLLYNTRISRIGFDLRGHQEYHQHMIPHPTWPDHIFDVKGDPESFYDKPIAVLTGPGAVSNGDWESVRLGFHPNSRVFGKPTSGAFTLNDYPDLGYPNWFFTKATGSGYVNPGHVYMAHTSAPIDEEVWLTKDDVARGVDTVVEAAIAWIYSQNDELPIHNTIPEQFTLERNYPNPFNTTTRIPFILPSESTVEISIFDVTGHLVRRICQNRKYSEGHHHVCWDATDKNDRVVGSGVYIYQLKSSDKIRSKKMLFVK